MGPLGIVLLVLLVLFLLRVPIGIVLIASSMVGILLAPNPIPMSTLSTTMWQGINNSVLLAIPFFILLGDLAETSGVTERLVVLLKAHIGHIFGGLGHVVVLSNIVMAGMTGSDLADAAATSKLLVPAMKRAGFPVGYAASLIGGAAMIGPMFPPSIDLIIFANTTESSVGRLFLGGMIPGGLLAAFLMAQAWFVARRNGYPREVPMRYRQRLQATIAGLPVLMIPVIVLGSILSGVATPTEAAVFGVIAVVLIGGLVYRELTLAAFARRSLATVRTVGSVFLIIAGATLFGRMLTLYGAAESLSHWLTGVTTSPVVFLLIVNGVYLVLGCVLEVVPILLVLVPLLMPTVHALGINTVHFGVMTVFNLLIGMIAPPSGLTMYLLCRVAEISMVEFWRFMWPIFLIMLFALSLVTMIPGLTTWLPNVLLPMG